MRQLYLSLAIIALLFSYSGVSGEVRHSTLASRLARSADSFENVMSSSVSSIPPEILSRAEGIMIFRQYGGGFFWGGKAGYGIVMAREKGGQWGPPAFLKTGDGSFGLQIGVQRIDLVFLFMNRNAMEVFKRGKFRLGASMGATAGPVGGGAEGKVGAPVLVYGDNAGLFIGAAFEGGLMLPDGAANSAFYETDGITVPEILYHWRGEYPPEAMVLRKSIQRWDTDSPRHGRPDTDLWGNPRRPSKRSDY